MGKILPTQFMDAPLQESIVYSVTSDKASNLAMWLMSRSTKKLEVSGQGGLQGFQFGRMELSNFQNLATTT